MSDSCHDGLYQSNARGVNSSSVESMTYQLRSKGTKFVDPPAVEGDEPDFSYRLDEGWLHVRMTAHFPSVDAARAVVDPFLRAWETSFLLRSIASNGRAVHFDFKEASVKDLAPSHSSGVESVGIALEIAKTSVSWEMHAETYPAPPHALANADVAQKLARRYRDYREGKEKLPSLAYYSLTAAEQEGLRLLPSEGSKRKAAARHFNLSRKLLNRLGDLAGTEGTDGRARKYAPEASSAHSEEDLKWLDAATRALIGQIADVETGENPPKLTNGDLP